MADELGLEVDWFSPEPGGRDQTFRRDFEMVEAADEVVAYFDAETPMEGGTAHLVEAALVRNVQVHAWTIGLDGFRVRIGELEV
jgi:hypothetical protein